MFSSSVGMVVGGCARSREEQSVDTGFDLGKCVERFVREGQELDTGRRV
jgi:hypothetical protein